jgi:hypothetical protein
MLPAVPWKEEPQQETTCNDDCGHNTEDDGEFRPRNAVPGPESKAGIDNGHLHVATGQGLGRTLVPPTFELEGWSLKAKNRFRLD